MFLSSSREDARDPFPVTAIELDPQKQARKELKEVFKAMQEQSVIKGTDDISLEEINAIINECRQEAGFTDGTFHTPS